MLRKKPFRHSPVLFFSGKMAGATVLCRVVQLVHAESYDLFMPSRTTCSCRVVRLVHAGSYDLFMPGRATCPCRVVRLVHAGSYDLFMPGRTDIKKKTAHPAVSKIRSPFFVMRLPVRVLHHHFRHRFLPEFLPYCRPKTHFHFLRKSY